MNSATSFIILIITAQYVAAKYLLIFQNDNWFT